MNIDVPTLSEWLLSESPMYVIDDWEGESIKLEHISMRVLPLYWTKLDGDIKEHVYISNDKERAMIGMPSAKIKGYFTIVTEMEIKHYDKLGPLRGNILNVTGVKTVQALRGKGYGIKLYKTLLDNDFQILSDSMQYNGARRLYQKLYDSGLYKFDAYDEGEKELHKNVILKHGELDADIDANHWSLDASKMNWKFFVHK